VLFRHLDAMPKVGDGISIEGFDFIVQEMDGHRIARVLARKGVLGDDDVELPNQAAQAGEVSASAEVVPLPTAATGPDDVHSVDEQHGDDGSKRSGGQGQ